MAGHLEVERLLRQARDQPREAIDALLPLVYDELRTLAHSRLSRGRPGETLNTTALVHETYLKLVGHGKATYRDHKHFFTVCAVAMRQIVVDYARYRSARKRGGAAAHTLLDELDGSALGVDDQATAVVRLDDALSRLSEVDERLARVVELRFFAGLSVEETAEVLEVSAATVKRDTRAARAFLAREMDGEGKGDVGNHT